MVRIAVPRLTLPARLTPAPVPRPPKAKSPWTLTALAIVRTVPSLSSEVPPRIWSVPRPIGPLVTVPVRGVELAPNISAPPARVKSVVKVLWPLRARTPEPALVNVDMPTFWVITEVIVRPVSARPALTVMTAGALNSRGAEMFGTETGDWLVAVMALTSVRISFAPPATSGLLIAPSLRKVSDARVLLPARLSVPPPMRLTLEAGLIWPSLVTIVTVELVAEARPLITRFPGMTRKPAEALRFNVPALT